MAFSFRPKTWSKPVRACFRVALILSLGLTLLPIAAQAKKTSNTKSKKTSARHAADSQPASAPDATLEGAASQPRKALTKAELKKNARSATPLAGWRIGLDAGNGGDAPLQHLSPERFDPYLLLEETGANRRVGLALKVQLEKLGAEVVPLAEPAPRSPLEERLAQAHGMNFDVVLSIQHSYSVHASDDLTAAYYSSSGSKTAEIMARRINEALSAGLGLPSTGALATTHPLGNLTNTPVVLVICSLMTNPDEFIHLMDDDYDQQQAAVIAQGVVTAVREQAGLLNKTDHAGKALQPPVWRTRLAQAAKMNATPATQITPHLMHGPLNTVGIPPVSPSATQPVGVAELPPATVTPAPSAASAPAAAHPADWKNAFKTLEQAQNAEQVHQAVQSEANAGANTAATFPSPIPTPSPSPKPSPTPGPSPTPTPPIPVPTLTPTPTPMPIAEQSAADAGPAGAPSQTETTMAPMPSGESASNVPFHAVFPRPVNAPIDQTWLFGETYEGGGNGCKLGDSFAAVAGSSIHAVADGKVVEAVYDSTPSPILPFAHSILIEHKTKLGGQMVYTLYGQMAEIVVTKGELVKAGQLLGKTGAPFDISVNDRSTEFEFQIWVGGESVAEARNPELFLQPFDKQTGLIVGQIIDAQHQPLSGQKINGVKKASDLYSYSLSYDGSAKPTAWQENFTIGDVPAGNYQLTFGDGQTRVVDVKPGQVSCVSVSSHP